MWMADEDNPAKSMDDVAAYYNKSNGVKLRHFIIEFDRAELSNPQIADNIVREIMHRIGNAFQWLMRELGVEQVFIDRMSGKNTDRPELKRMMSFVREVDTVIVEAISRFARNTKDLSD